MSELLDSTTLSSPAIIKAMEANISLIFPRLFASAAFSLQPGANLNPLMYASGVPFPVCNGVIQANFSDEEADQKIAETLEYFKTREYPMIWFVLPTSTPANLGERLIAQGLVKLEEDTGMEIDLTAWQDEEMIVPGLELHQVEDEPTLKEWVSTFLKGYNLPDFLDEVMNKGLIQLGLDPEGNTHHFLGYLNGKPVATSTLFLAEGIAAIYNVATLEEARGRGIGREMTRAAMLLGRAKGYKVAVLESTELGYNVYRKLGFQDNCKLGQYLWMKETEAE